MCAHMPEYLCMGTGHQEEWAGEHQTRSGGRVHLGRALPWKIGVTWTMDGSLKIAGVLLKNAAAFSNGLGNATDSDIT